MATRVKLLKKEKLKNAILFTGLPGIGLVGKISVDYLLRQLKATKVAEIYSDSFPPSVHTNNSVIELIKDELYFYENGKKQFLFLSGPVQPSLDFRTGSAIEHYEFAEKVVETAKELGVKEVYTLAGINIGEKRMEKTPSVVVAATSKKMLDEFKKFNVKPAQDDGLISGAAGLVLGIGKEHGLEGACLMGETNARLVYGDHGSAKKLLELLVKKFGFKISMAEIEKESKKIERAFAQLTKSLEGLDDEPPGLSYVR
jgi:hypothetical protein